MSTEGSGGAAAEKTPGKVVAAGAPEAGDLKIPIPPTPSPDDNGGGKTAEQIAAEAAAAEAAKGAGSSAEPTPEQVKAFFQKHGIEWDGKEETLKEKFKPVTAEPTAEEKAAAEQALDKRMLDTFMKNGGTAEAYVQLKQIASADLKQLSVSEIKREMKEGGFDDTEIDLVLKERYYQLNPDELQKSDDETDEAFAKRKELAAKKVKYGTAKLETKATYVKKQAENILSGLRKAIDNQELLDKEETKFSSKVDEFVSKLPRKVTFQLGKVNDQEILPVDFDVKDEDIAPVVDTLKDPAKRNKFFFNEDNSLNLENVGSVMVRNAYLEKALKAVYREASDRQVDAFEKVFPGKSAKDIGVGGAAGRTTGRKGHVVSAGQPVPADLPKK